MTDRLLPHALRPLLAPRSIAVVGASERQGSIGRIVLENVLAGSFHGDVHAVNPRHRSVLGRKSFPSLAAIGAAVDLAIVCAPSRGVPGILDAGGRLRPGMVVLLGDPPAGDVKASRGWRRDVAQIAARQGLRVVGPGAFGVIRPGIGLNASVSSSPVATGRLALVAQSGAMCRAMLDFAAPFRIGFSLVTSLGAAVDVGFGEMLDALVLDDDTDAILLYVESVRDARRFMSALRAAARTKPVVVLKAGRSLEPQQRGGAPTADAVFETALRRAGTVRVRSYTQLFAAARILALGRIPRGDRVAIVANGRGPALLAADSALERAVPLATLDPSTLTRLAALLPETSLSTNPVDIRDDAPPERLAGAIEALLADSGVDAVLALHVPHPALGAIEAARAVAAVTRGADKPVLAAWLGAIERPEVREALETGEIANFYTPENAIEAFSFLAAYRRHQAWLLEVPPPKPDPERPDLAAAEAVRVEAEALGRNTLTDVQAQRLLAAFGLGDAPQRGAPKRRSSKSSVTTRTVHGDQPSLVLGVYTDSTFGPVIAVSPRLGVPAASRSLMLPPLNDRLAAGLVAPYRGKGMTDEAFDRLVRRLVAVSALVCALPWVVEMELDGLEPGNPESPLGVTRIVVDHRRAQLANYAHLAIHPYPAELTIRFAARNGVIVTVRPIRPEDAALEQRFVNALSERTRYLRFFYRMHELTPAMLARFTQVDYDRELALVAVVEDGTAPEGMSFVGVARFSENPDRTSAEYAIVVHDAWQGQAIGFALMLRLIDAARRKGLARLEGAVLRENAGMLAFVRRLGFEVRDDAGEPEQVLTTLELAAFALNSWPFPPVTPTR